VQDRKSKGPCAIEKATDVQPRPADASCAIVRSTVGARGRLVADSTARVISGIFQTATPTVV
jgi:hypothetical protein